MIWRTKMSLTTPDAVRLTLTHPQVNQELVNEFIFRFARFEYALKRAGYLRTDKKYPEVDWKHFVESLSTNIEPTSNPGLSRAKHYLEQNPPRRQVVRQGQLDWSTIERESNESDIAWLLRAVRTVRNNLFHGGKFSTGPISDPSRDTELLQSAVIILKEIVNSDSSVARHFKEPLA
jgi:hypothetical protein